MSNLKKGKFIKICPKHVPKRYEDKKISKGNIIDEYFLQKLKCMTTVLCKTIKEIFVGIN